jgi:hypothetical protein
MLGIREMGGCVRAKGHHDGKQWKKRREKRETKNVLVDIAAFSLSDTIRVFDAAKK